MTLLEIDRDSQRARVSRAPSTRKMKLLISAFACAPNMGSEEGVGWNWTTEAHRLGHQVYVLVWPIFREAIEAACRADPGLAGIKWFFPEVKGWPVKPGIKAKWERTYCLLWQRAALSLARELCSSVEFDIVHHLTWSGLRVPTFLGSLGRPLIIGPIGGGETSPRSLRDEFPLRGKLLERIRDLANSTVTISPLIRRELAEASMIFVKTPETLELLTRKMQEKSIGFAELSLRAAQIGKPRAIRQQPRRLLYAGRLLYWKGVHIAIRAFSHVSRRCPDARFTIVGRGPELPRLKEAAARYDVADRIDFISWLPQEQLFDLYGSHDLFVFPSLHDSGGSVALEALSQGLPVICLDLGGPKQIVSPSSGVVVGTAGRNSAQVAAAMADAISRLLAEPADLATLSAGAIARAQDFVLSSRVAEFYDRASSLIDLSNKSVSETGRAMIATTRGRDLTGSVGVTQTFS
jgi:glycosyltransferase involved in cell wall biosynthesis